MFSKCFLCFRLIIPFNYLSALSSVSRALHAAPITLSNLIHIVLFGEEYKSWRLSVSRFSPDFSHFLPLRTKCSHSAPVSRKLSAYIIPNAKDLASRPYKAARIIVLYSVLGYCSTISSLTSGIQLSF